MKYRGSAPPSAEVICPPKETAAVYSTLGVFAVLLALATFRHEMYLDEVHPWLITRHSRDILDLLHHLRYEGHPALLYFLIYPLSHISNQVAWIKVPNCLFALLMGWLILTERRIEFIIRVLILFSVPVFFEMGVVARNYALAGALLIAASRCLLRDRPWHWLAMACLVLAINSHFLAIPVALGIFVWLYWLAPAPSWRAAAGRLTESRFWISCALLSAALIACYFTLRPAADAYVQEYQYPGVTGLGYLTLGIGKLWHQFLPVPLGMFSASTQELLAPLRRPSLLALSLTIALWLLVVSALPTRRSRWFMLSTPPLWMAAAWFAVHVPTAFHATFIAVIFVIALFLNSAQPAERAWLPQRFAAPVLVIILSIQMVACGFIVLVGVLQPFSAAKATAQWLKSAGLASRPLVIQPDSSGPAILAYANIASAYFPSCRCMGSFVVLNGDRIRDREVTLEEMQALAHEFGAAPVVISRWQLQEQALRRLQLRLVYVSPHGWGTSGENVFVYDSSNPIATEASRGQR